MRRFRARLATTLSLIVIAGACGGSADPPEAATVVDGEVSPLTREQIEEHAEAMSPEKAESLGIVDTTIAIEAPTPTDSEMIAPPGGDSARQSR
jgi:hypothetical protein